MIPLRDETRLLSRFAGVTALITGINAAAFLTELAGGEAFTGRWAGTNIIRASPRNPSDVDVHACELVGKAGSVEKACRRLPKYEQRHPHHHSGKGLRQKAPLP